MCLWGVYEVFFLSYYLCDFTPIIHCVGEDIYHYNLMCLDTLLNGIILSQSHF